MPYTLQRFRQAGKFRFVRMRPIYRRMEGACEARAGASTQHLKHGSNSRITSPRIRLRQKAGFGGQERGEGEGSRDAFAPEWCK